MLPLGRVVGPLGGGVGPLGKEVRPPGEGLGPLGLGGEEDPRIGGFVLLGAAALPAPSLNLFRAQHIFQIIPDASL